MIKSLLILLLPLLINAESCKRSGIQCITDKSYQICSILNGAPTLVGSPILCENDDVCDDLGCFPCVNKESATPLPEVPPPECTEHGVYPATQCHQYYECVQQLWWWQPQLQTCPFGQNYKPELGICGQILPTDCPRNDAPEIQAPACTESGLHPAQHCNQYYACEKCLLWWKPKLKTCAANQAFNAISSQCEDSGRPSALPYRIVLPVE